MIEREYAQWLSSRGCVVHRAPRPAQSRFHARSPRDFFGIYDFLVLTPKNGLRCVQVTTVPGAPAHRRKIESFFKDADVSIGSLLDLLTRTVLVLRRKGEREDRRWRHQCLSKIDYLNGVFTWQEMHELPFRPN